MVPLGILLDDPKVKNQTQQFLDYVLDHQDSTGWLGPEVNTTKPRYLWGRLVSKLTISISHPDTHQRYPFFFGAIQMLEANPALESRIVPALHKFVSLANTMLHNGQGQDDWAKTRWEDFVMVLQWYENCGRNVFITLTWSLLSGYTTSTQMGKKIFLSTP